MHFFEKRLDKLLERYIDVGIMIITYFRGASENPVLQGLEVLNPVDYEKKGGETK